MCLGGAGCRGCCDRSARVQELRARGVWPLSDAAPSVAPAAPDGHHDQGGHDVASGDYDQDQPAGSCGHRRMLRQATTTKIWLGVVNAGIMAGTGEKIKGGGGGADKHLPVQKITSYLNFLISTHYYTLASYDYIN